MESLQVEKKLADWSHTGTYEYLLAVPIAADVNESVDHERRSLFGNDTRSSLQLNYISVAAFTGRDEMESTVIRYLERIISARSNFQVSLNNYSGIPPHTIFLRVQDVTPFRLLTKQLAAVSDYVQSCSCPPLKVCHPHVVVANNLGESNYFKLMLLFSQMSFFASFSVNEVVLLRRSHSFDAGKKLQVFPLMPAGYQSFKNTLFN